MPTTIFHRPIKRRTPDFTPVILAIIAGATLIPYLFLDCAGDTSILVGGISAFIIALVIDGLRRNNSGTFSGHWRTVRISVPVPASVSATRESHACRVTVHRRRRATRLSQTEIERLSYNQYA